MKAIQQRKYGKPLKVLEIRYTPIPTPTPLEVLIKVHCAALNPIDIKIAQGKLKAILPLKLPAKVGFDVSGVIEQVGCEVSDFEVGDKVFCRLPLHQGGAFSDYVCANENHIALIPNISFEEAASLPLVGLTVIQALYNRTKTGMKILIHGGSGGVGSFAVQYAKKYLNLEVTATASKRSVPFVKSLGADSVIAYDEENYLKTSDKYDVVFDTLGGIHTLNSFRILKKNGTVVSIGGPPDLKFVWSLNTNILHKIILFPLLTLSSLHIYLIALFKNAKYYRFLTKSNRSQLEVIKKIVDDGYIIPVVDKIFPFEEYQNAFKHLINGKPKGKVILKVRE
ncbi:NADP-dependent oxidoreductase [uncultured Croceitalea sp.]|uniref:NADP-dependent oxidoreductase n=1 Tax=uncultured Croceitalea sp. TaxID=1798908 RepID=UPI003305F85E